MSLLSVTEAQERIAGHFRPVGTELVPLDRCAGRVLAQDVVATDLPLFDNSSVDGFAVLASDVSSASEANPQTLPVVADIPAGSSPEIRLTSGQAARIMTGAPLPQGADAVIMIEDTDVDQRAAGTPAPAQVKAFKPVHAGENVRTRGMDMHRGDVILHPGRRLRPQEVGMLAMLSIGNVQVYKKPRVALLSSGNELTTVDQPLEPGKIRDTNTYTLGAAIVNAGCELLSLGIAPDEGVAIRTLFERAVEQQADMIISSAGVSVGALDFVRQIVEADGRLDFWRVNMRPGKPLAFGDYRGIPFVGLPGNPVSACVGFEVFVRPALALLSGANGPAAPRSRIWVRLAEGIESDGRESYLRAILSEKNGEVWARLTGHQGSGNLLSLVQADALLIIPAGVKSLAIGSPAEAWLL